MRQSFTPTPTPTAQDRWMIKAQIDSSLLPNADIQAIENTSEGSEPYPTMVREAFCQLQTAVNWISKIPKFYFNPGQIYFKIAPDENGPRWTLTVTPLYNVANGFKENCLTITCPPDDIARTALQQLIQKNIVYLPGSLQNNILDAPSMAKIIDILKEAASKETAAPGNPTPSSASSHNNIRNTTGIALLGGASQLLLANNVTCPSGGNANNHHPTNRTPVALWVTLAVVALAAVVGLITYICRRSSQRNPLIPSAQLEEGSEVERRSFHASSASQDIELASANTPPQATDNKWQRLVKATSCQHQIQ